MTSTAASPQVKGHLLRRHTSLRGAYVYAPVADFSTDDVWRYLLQAPSPWGNDNRDLAALYRSASAGECPLVIDTSTPSCGNTRFGCWVCTVAERDTSMEALIDNGEEWMEPLSVPRIFRWVNGHDLDWPTDDNVHFDATHRLLLEGGLSQEWRDEAAILAGQLSLFPGE